MRYVDEAEAQTRYHWPLLVARLRTDQWLEISMEELRQLIQSPTATARGVALASYHSRGWLKTHGVRVKVRNLPDGQCLLFFKRVE